MLEILIVLAIAIVVSVFISLPFFRKNRFDQPYLEEETDPIQGKLIQRLNALNNEKESLYNALKDIEFDYELGKLSKSDFEGLNLSYKSKAISILKEIDEIDNEINLKAIENNIGKDIKIESEERSEEDGGIEREILPFRKLNKNGGQLLKCLGCGRECNSEDIFCSKCGAKLKVENTNEI